MLLTEIFSFELSAARDVLWDLLAGQVSPFRNSFHFVVKIFKFKYNLKLFKKGDIKLKIKLKATKLLVIYTVN